MSQEARDRQQFLSDIIAELSRQQQDDAVAFQGQRTSPPEEAFRKLCFDYPEVDQVSFEGMFGAVSDLLSGTRTTPVVQEWFHLHEKFVHNVILMSNASTDSSDEGKIKAGKTANKLAAALFLSVPNFVLGMTAADCNSFLCREQEATWRQIIFRYCSFMRQSSVSAICCGRSDNQSSDVLQLLQDGSHLSAATKAIATLGMWVTAAEDAMLRHKSSAEEDASGETSNAVDVWAQLSEAGPSTTLADLLTFIVSRCDHGAAAERTQSFALLKAVHALIKPCWLHLTLFVRDLLVQLPQLVPTKAAQLFAALLEPSGSGALGCAVRRDGPSSMQCLYVVVLASLCGACSGEANSGVPSAVARTVALLHAKNALRTYLDVHLAQIVDICASMTVPPSSSASRYVDMEVAGFLVDVASVYCGDPCRVTVGTRTRAAANVIPVLVSSRLLPLLLADVVTLLEQQQQSVNMVDAQSFSPPLVALSNRLMGCLALLVLPGAGGAAVVQYVLQYPALVERIGQLPAMWDAASSRNEATATAPQLLVCEEQALGLVSTVLLSALHPQVTPGGGAVTLAAEAQFTLLTVLTKALDGVKRRLTSLQRTSNVIEGTAETTGASPTGPIATETEAAAATPSTSTASADEPTEDATAEDKQNAKAAKKRSAQVFQAELQFLDRLISILVVLAGEGACAPLLRAVCAAVGWKQSNSTTALCAIVQTVFKSFAADALTMVSEAMQRLRTTDGSSTGVAEDRGAALLPRLETIKKHLKSLHGLLSGDVSSKSD